MDDNSKQNIYWIVVMFGVLILIYSLYGKYRLQQDSSEMVLVTSDLKSAYTVVIKSGPTPLIVDLTAVLGGVKSMDVLLLVVQFHL